MKNGRETNFIMIPLNYAESPNSLFANKELKTEVIADLIGYADSHDLKWEYFDLTCGRKYWHVWDDHGFIHGFIRGRGIGKILKKNGLELRKNLFGCLVLCEVD